MTHLAYEKPNNNERSRNGKSGLGDGCARNVDVFGGLELRRWATRKPPPYRQIMGKSHLCLASILVVCHFQTLSEVVIVSQAFQRKSTKAE